MNELRRSELDAAWSPELNFSLAPLKTQQHSIVPRERRDENFKLKFQGSHYLDNFNCNILMLIHNPLSLPN
jgi:hypothetical protein